ncbi:MAG TPA: YceI family protein, partial [Kofleriaceae bacterium]
MIAIVAALARWSLQGSHNLYTAIAKRFYVPDPDLGWRVSSQHPIWLGLEVIAVLVAMAIGLAGLTWFLKARKPRLAAILAKLGWVGAALAVAVPVAAFASGPGPLDARDTLPPSAAVKLEGGIEGTLSAPAGAYQIVQHEGTAVTAHLSAGHEEFDARFPSVAGQWAGDPGDLAKPMHAQITVTTASIDTGVGERSKHAREAYLHADQFPNIAVELANVTAVRQTAPNEVAFRAPGSVHLLGKTHTVEITGTLQRPDAA